MPQVPGNTIQGAGGYGSYPGNPYRDRYVWITMPDGEARHVAASVAIGIIARNPFVSASVGIFHGLYHVSELVYDERGDFRSIQSPRGGGPGHSLISTNPPLSLEATGASLAQLGKSEGPARPSKRGNRPRRRYRQRSGR